MRGMTLIEVIFSIAVLVLVFGGIMVSFQFMLALVGSSKAQAGAIALANEKLEYIRSLPYDSIGTIGGIPDGPIPQVSTTSMNGVKYTERVLIEYIDAPEDGEGAGDSNGILADYKLAKVVYSWTDKSGENSISLISNIIPKGIETTAGGGTLRVNVFDANVAPVAGAAVHVYNDSGPTTIDTVRYTNSDGVALFSGAPALANYQIDVSLSGYSSDQTYQASVSNPNPSTLPVAVLESQVSTMNFQIDRLSDLRVATLGLPTVGEFEDLFDDTYGVATSTDVSIALGEVTLAGTSGSYSSLGTVFSTSIEPGTLDSWNTFSYQSRTPANTTIRAQVYDLTSPTTPVLISDADLPGNSIGFGPGTTDLSGLDTGVYQKLALGAVLTSDDTATTSALLEWNVTYTVSQTAIAHVPFTIKGSKSIGVDASSAPIPKYSALFTTDATGVTDITNLEWDIYDVIVTDTSYDVAEACRDIPYVLEPGVSETLTLTLASEVTYSLRVHVVDINGDEIPNATVDVSRTGFSESKDTSICGQVFFNSGLSSASDYTLNVSAFGYTSQQITDFTVDGTNTTTITLTSV
jgi:hypothetical protein